MLEQGLLQILEKVYEQTHLDFRQYKESSLKRRIERRLRATKTESYQQYIEVLDTDPSEYTRLIGNLTIKVTEFFRNPQAWQVIRNKILPEIVSEKTERGNIDEGTNPVLRIWSAGCATGQEVYSGAILVDQLLGERKNELEVNIWGTDIDKESLLKARQAEYKSNIVKEIPQDILNKYFNFHGDFTPKPFIRDWVYFKSHDLVLDEPLKHIDMIICRNVIIYFEKPLQEKVFMNFYTSLNKKGYLFLGKAETLIGPAREKFKAIDKQWRIYQKA
jgi:chemotaxis protein methyltransferase CheR